MGVLDFAGGTVVHVSSGIAALLAAIMIGRRLTIEGESQAPGNLILTITGAGLLWFGWFGFNAGSAVAAESPVSGFVAGLAFTTTQTAVAFAGVGTFAILFAIKATLGLRVSEEDERKGLDITIHGEQSYRLTPGM